MESLELDFPIELVRKASVLNPKVSIVLTCFNDSKYLNECLNSIFEQTFDDFDIIILDNGSSDDTQLILSKYSDKRLTIYKSKVNIGASKGLVFLFGKASGSYLKVFCADDKMNADCLEVLCAQAIKDGAAIVCSRMHTMSEASVEHTRDLLGSLGSARPSKFFLQSLTERNPICFPTVMLKRDQIRDLDLDCRFASLFDLNLWSQILARNGTKLSLVNRSLVAYRLRKKGGNYSSIGSSNRRNQIFVETLLWMRQTFSALSGQKLFELFTEIKGPGLTKTKSLTDKDMKAAIARHMLENKNYLNHFSIDAHQIYFAELLLENCGYENPEFDRDKEVASYFDGLKIKMTRKYFNLFNHYANTIGVLGAVRKSFHYLFR